MPPASKRLYDFGPFRLDAAEGLLLRDGRPVPLKPKVLETLLVLVENSAHVLDKTELMQRLWPDTFVEEANLAVNISQLRKALGQTEPDAVFIETVPKRGYRFVAPVTSVEVDSGDVVIRERTRSRIVVEETVDEPMPVGVATAAPLDALPGRRQTTRLVLAAAVVCAAVVAALALSRQRTPSTAVATAPRSLAVLHFRSLKPDPETDFLGSALADAITTRLGEVRSIVVRPSAYVSSAQSPRLELQKVAKELGADALLTGTYLKDGGDLRINAQLIDVAKEAIVWHDSIDVPFQRLLDVQDRVSQQIIKGLELQISPDETARLKLDAARNPVAYETYLRGRHLISSTNHATAVRMLEESVRLDPTYALAWAWLGKAHSVTASQFFGGHAAAERARAAYDRALALTPTPVEARVLAANFRTENNRVEEAVPPLRAVIETNPNHAFARWELSYAYRYGGLLDASVREGEIALELNPNLKAHLFNSYFYRGDYNRFLASLPRRDDAYINFYRGLGLYYAADRAGAAAAFDRAHQLDPRALLSQIARALSLSIAARGGDGVDLLKAAEQKTVE